MSKNLLAGFVVLLFAVMLPAGAQQTPTQAAIGAADKEVRGEALRLVVAGKQYDFEDGSRVVFGKDDDYEYVSPAGERWRGVYRLFDEQGVFCAVTNDFEHFCGKIIINAAGKLAIIDETGHRSTSK